MSRSGVAHPKQAYCLDPWRDLWFLNIVRNLRGRDKRLRGAVPFSPGRSLVYQGFWGTRGDVHEFATMLGTDKNPAHLRLSCDVRGFKP